MPRDGNGGDVGGDLNQPQVLPFGTAGLMEVHGEGTEHGLPGIADGGGPTSLQIVAKRDFPVLVPQRIGSDIFHDDGLPEESGGAARAGTRANRLAIDAADELIGKAARRSVPQVYAVGIQEK